MPALRLSVVQYLNTVPLIWGMLHGEQRGKFELQLTVPSGCADAIAQRQADVGIVPSIEYQRLEGLEILPGMSIASKRQVKSVVLLSKMPLAKVQTVALDESSRTSAALVRILMQKFYSRRVNFSPAAPEPGEMLRQADAALLIGDPALTYSGPRRRSTTSLVSGGSLPGCPSSSRCGWATPAPVSPGTSRTSPLRSISGLPTLMTSPLNMHPNWA